MFIKLQGVLVPASAMPVDLRFHKDVLGEEPALVDGDRYAAFSATGSFRLALAGAEEWVYDEPSVVLRASDIGAALDLIVAAGGTVLMPTENGPHELRALAADPSGNALVITQ